MKLKLPHFSKRAMKPHGLIFEFALLSGMRPEEYLALQWRDLNFERNTAQVRRALYGIRRFGVFRNPKRREVSEPLRFPQA